MAEHLQIHFATLFTLSGLIRPPQGVLSQALPAFLGVTPWDDTEKNPSFNTQVRVHTGAGSVFHPQNVANYTVIPAGLIVPTPNNKGIAQIQTIAEKLVKNRNAVTQLPIEALLGLCDGVKIEDVWVSFSNQT